MRTSDRGRAMTQDRNSPPLSGTAASLLRPSPSRRARHGLHARGQSHHRGASHEMREAGNADGGERHRAQRSHHGEVHEVQDVLRNLAADDGKGQAPDGLKAGFLHAGSCSDLSSRCLVSGSASLPVGGRGRGQAEVARFGRERDGNLCRAVRRGFSEDRDAGHVPQPPGDGGHPACRTPAAGASARYLP